MAAGGSGGGILAECHDSLVTNNIVRDITDVGITVTGDRNTVSYNTISGVTTSFDSGIYLEGANSNEIVYNTVTNCPYAVMIFAGMTSSSNYNHVAYNHFDTIHTNNMAYIHACSSDSSKKPTGSIFEQNTYVGTWQTYDGGISSIIRNNIKQ